MKSKRHVVVDRALKLSRELLVSSEKNMLLAEDDGCVMLCGIFRDFAYQLKLQAQLEQERHMQQEAITEPETLRHPAKRCDHENL